MSQGGDATRAATELQLERPPDALKRPSKGQRRLNTILAAIPDAREQMLVAVEEFRPDFDATAFLAAARSPDARERNKVAVIEREYEVLLNWMHELAARALAEGQRLGVIEKEPGHPWERLAALGVISHRAATRLQEVKELRDDLARAYPPAGWKALHEGVQVLLAELDRYMDHCERWLSQEGILVLDAQEGLLVLDTEEGILGSDAER